MPDHLIDSNLPSRGENGKVLKIYKKLWCTLPAHCMQLQIDGQVTTWIIICLTQKISTYIYNIYSPVNLIHFNNSFCTSN